MNANTYGDWLKWQRNRRGWKQRTVEERAGVEHSQYSKWENNHNRPEPGTRQKFHDLYETSDDDLVELGILTTYPGIDGSTHYTWAENITPGDREAARVREGWAPYDAPERHQGLVTHLKSYNLTERQIGALLAVLDAFVDAP